MTTTEIVQIRQDISAAQQAGDIARANSLYARSLELQSAAQSNTQGLNLRSQSSVSSEVQSAAAALVEARGRAESKIESFRRSGYSTDVQLVFDDPAWRGNDGQVEQLALASAFVHDHPELIPVVERFGVSEIAALALAAVMARRLGRIADGRPGRRTTDAKRRVRCLFRKVWTHGNLELPMPKPEEIAERRTASTR